MMESEEVFRPSETLTEGDRLRDAELRMLASQPLDVPAATVARHLGAGGTVVTVSSACASGTQALGVALDALRSGEVEVAVVGGADSLCRLTYAGFNALRVVDERACRPFRAGRAGMTLGEGAGVVVIEPEKRALERVRTGRARIFATLLGVGNSCDAHHMTAPHPEGLGASLAVRRALRDAGLPADVSSLAFLNAHGTGTPLNDLSEWRGVASVFGSDASTVPLTATKASVGHLLGSSGAIEAVVTALSLHRAVVPPTPRSGEPDEEIDPETPGRLVLDDPLEIDFREDGAEGGRGAVALSTSFGFGGANAAAAFGRVTPEPGSGTGAVG
jgi:3-oxoacyl-(acyl-carrier-protein) synthase